MVAFRDDQSRLEREERHRRGDGRGLHSWHAPGRVDGAFEESHRLSFVCSEPAIGSIVSFAILEVRKPGPCANALLDTSNAQTATLTRTKESATCRATSRFRPVRRRRLVVSASLVLSAVTRFTRVVWMAGPRPNRSALPMAMAMLKTSARRLICEERHRRHFGRETYLPEQDNADLTHGQPADAAGDGDADTLGDQLADQAAASRPDGHAQRDLARADRRAAGEEAGHIGARDAQDGERQGRDDHDQPGIERAAART